MLILERVNDFFVADRFSKEDITYTAKLLGIPLNDIDLTTYKNKIPADHQASILKLLDYKPFDQNAIEWLFEAFPIDLYGSFKKQHSKELQ